VALGVVGGFIGAFAGSRPEVQPLSDPSEFTASPESSTLVAVHVSGQVVSPGVVWVEDGALAVEAIAAAGGALPDADLDSLNLAQPVYEGDQVVVRSVASGAGGPDPVDDGLIDINRAGLEELQNLPGVGPVLAGNIVAYRESVGRFETLEDLLEVPGIGETRLASIRDLIRPP
jgi:competence protein ComEA